MLMHPDADHDDDENDWQGSPIRLTGNSTGATQSLQVFKEAFDDKQEGQGDDGQIVATCLEGRYRHDQGGQRGHDAPENQRQRKGEIGHGKPQFGSPQHLVVHKKANSKQGGHVSANGHETGMGAGKLTHVAIDDIETQGKEYRHQHDFEGNQPIVAHGGP